jgi:hypothetical protein
MNQRYIFVWLVLSITKPLMGFCSICVDDTVKDTRQAPAQQRAAFLAQNPQFARYLKTAHSSQLIALAGTEPRHLLGSRNSTHSHASAQIQAQLIKDAVFTELAKRSPTTRRNTNKKCPVHNIALNDDSVPDGADILPLQEVQQALEEELKRGCVQAPILDSE